MDVALGQFQWRNIKDQLIVLILVVMDVALGPSDGVGRRNTYLWS